MNKSKNYLLITPIKNEKKNLSKLIESIAKQTIKPVLWIIIDDGSSDNSYEIIENTKREYNWIQSIRLENVGRDRKSHLANVIKSGFDFALEHSKRIGIKYSYLGNVDADITLDRLFFEKLIEKFEKNPKLGIASGSVLLVTNNETKCINKRFPEGGEVLYRKECFESCGGVQISGFWDTILNTKALLRGWEVDCFDDCRAFLSRYYCQAGNLWAEYEKIGEESYTVNYNPFYLFIKGVFLSFRKPHYHGVAYIYGYIRYLILQKEQIDDEEIKHYFWYKRPHEINQYYLSKLMKKLKTIL